MVILFENTIHKTNITSHLRSHENNKMHKVMHTQIVLGLIKIQSNPLKNPWYNFIWKELTEINT